MAFDNVSQWSVTPSLNTEISGVPLDGNVTLINQLDDGLRNIMAQVAAQFLDDQFYVGDNSDPTKKVQLDLSGITTATTRTLTVPNASGTLPLLEAPQTFSGANTFSGTNNFTGALQAAGVAIKAVRQVTTFTLGTGWTTTSTSPVITDTASITRKSTTSNLLVLGFVQGETETSAAVSSGLQVKFQYYTGTAYAAASGQPVTWLDNLVGTSRIQRNMLAMSTVLTAAQKRSDLTEIWTIAPFFNAIYTSCTAKVLGFYLIAIEYEP